MLTPEDLTEKLVSFSTTSDSPAERQDCINYIADLFGDSFRVQRFERDGEPSLLVSFHDGMTPSILLHGHLDVVDADDTMFHPDRRNGRIMGRGAADMKGGVACLIKTMKEVKDEQPDVALLLTSDEEQGGFRGTGSLVQDGELEPGFVISAEPDDSGQFPSIVTQQKGVLQAEITVNGESSHAARPDNGVNAAELLLDKYREIRELFDHEQEYPTTINLGTLNAGEDVNTVPDEASMQIDIRFSTQYPRDDVVDDLHDIDGISLDITAEAPMMEAADDDPHVELLRSTAEEITGSDVPLRRESFASDMRFFTENGVPAVCFGPEGYNVHSPDEYVATESFDSYIHILQTFITRATNG